MVAAGDEINAADLIALEDLTIRRPIVRLVQSAIQSIPNNTAQGVTFTSEDLDPLGFHDAVTNTTRITPTVPGWYRFNCSYHSATLTTPTLFAVFLRKNGVTSIPPGKRALYTSTVVSPSVSCHGLVQMDGVTDFVEMMALQASSAAVNTAVSAYIACTFELSLEYTG